MRVVIDRFDLSNQLVVNKINTGHLDVKNILLQSVKTCQISSQRSSQVTVAYSIYCINSKKVSKMFAHHEL